MFWAGCCLAYFRFLCSSKLTVPNGAMFSQALNLSVHDIAADKWVAPSRIQMNIKVSQTDPFRQGCILILGQGPLCPVAAMLNFFQLWGSSVGLLFIRSNGVPLTRTYLSEQLCQLLCNVGIPGNFSSHSFHIGASTSAALVGVSDHLIETLRQWSSSNST
jgi:hypothetical protein